MTMLEIGMLMCSLRSQHPPIALIPLSQIQPQAALQIVDQLILRNPPGEILIQLLEQDVPEEIGRAHV